MITLEVIHEPVPWAAHKGFGRRAYNPRHKEREFYRWQIRTQYNRDTPSCAPVRITVGFYMPIPKTTSGIRRRQMLNGVIHHIKKPDIDNCAKFLIDTLKGIVIEDDNQVVELVAKKIYAETPKTIIRLEELNYPSGQLDA